MKRLVFAVVVFAVSAVMASATEIVFTPVNPSFGGNPLNGPVLLNIANAINKYRDPAVADALNRLNSKTPFEQFNERLQQAILDRIAGNIAGGTPTPGTYDAGSFLVTVVVNTDGSVTVTTTDKTTGNTTQITIPPL